LDLAANWRLANNSLEQKDLDSSEQARYHPEPLLNSHRSAKEKIMNLAKINPFLPKDPAEQKIYCETYKKELRIYRKKPSFWIGLLAALICSMVLMFKLDTIDRLFIFPIVFGLASVHDTVTSHFTKRLIEEKKPIGIGLPIAEEPSLITVRTDRVYGDSAVTDGVSSKAD